MTLLSNDNFIFPGFAGTKSIEIHNGDLTDFALPFDTLVVLAFRGDYKAVGFDKVNVKKILNFVTLSLKIKTRLCPQNFLRTKTVTTSSTNS